MTPSDRFLAFIPFILEWEGGYDNDPDDPGGETKYGIDKRSHPGEDIRNLTVERAQEIYLESYWLKMRCDELPAPVGEVVMNIGVNAGIGRAAKWLQGAVGAAQDGVIGPRTVAAVSEGAAREVADGLLERLEEHYRDIGKGKLAKFLKGWLNRTRALRKQLNLPEG